MSVGPLAGGGAPPDLAAIIAEELATLAADAQTLQTRLTTGDVVEAIVLPSNGLTDLLDIGGLRVAAELPPTLLPGETITVSVTGFTGDRINLQILSTASGPSTPKADAPSATVPKANTPSAAVPTANPASPDSNALRAASGRGAQDAVGPRSNAASPRALGANVSPAGARDAKPPGVAGQAAARSAPTPGSAPGRAASATPPVETPVSAAAPRPASPGPANAQGRNGFDPAARAGMSGPARVVRALPEHFGSLEARIATSRATVPPPAAPGNRPPVKLGAAAPSSPVVRRPVIPQRATVAPAAPPVSAAPARGPGAFAEPAALLRGLHLPVTPSNVNAARLALESPERLPHALAALERALSKNADPHVATLRTLIGFLTRLEPRSPVLATQVAAFVDHIVIGREGKLVQLLRAQSLVEPPRAALSAQAGTVPASPRDSAEASARVSGAALAPDTAVAPARDTAVALARDSAAAPMRNTSPGDLAKAPSQVPDPPISRGAVPGHAHDVPPVQLRDAASMQGHDTARVPAREAAAMRAPDTAPRLERDSTPPPARGGAGAAPTATLAARGLDGVRGAETVVVPARAPSGVRASDAVPRGPYAAEPVSSGSPGGRAPYAASTEPAPASADAAGERAVAASTLAAERVAVRQAALDYDLKTQLLAVRDDGRGSPGGPAPQKSETLTAAVSSALSAVTALQIGAASALAANPDGLAFALPIALPNGFAQAHVRIDREAPPAVHTALDGDNFHIAFVLETQHLGTVAIDLLTVGRSVTLGVKTEAAFAQRVFGTALTQLTSRLEALRYRVAKADAVVAPRAPAPEAPPTEAGSAAPPVERARLVDLDA